MNLKWTNKADSDLRRIYEFLSTVNKSVAIKTIKKIAKQVPMLLDNPRLGERLTQFNPREVRHLLLGNYEVRYELKNEMIYILRLWHAREDRQ